MGVRFQRRNDLQNIEAGKEEVLQSMVMKIKELSYDEKIRQQCEAREKYEKTILTQYRAGERKGIAQGMELGMAQGLERGLEQGREEGREEGRAEGREEGRAEGKAELASQISDAMNRGATLEDITRILHGSTLSEKK